MMDGSIIYHHDRSGAISIRRSNSCRAEGCPIFSTDADMDSGMLDSGIGFRRTKFMCPERTHIFFQSFNFFVILFFCFLLA